MKYVYVVMTEDREIVSVATDLVFAKKIVSDEFDGNYYEMRVEETVFGYRIIVQEEGMRHTFYVDRERLRGVL